MQTASRSVLVVAGIVLVAVSFVGKLAAGLSTIPEPILGGIFLVIIGILVAIGVSTLKHVDLHSTRNIIIIGVAIFIGVVLPDWIATYPESIDTGAEHVSPLSIDWCGWMRVFAWWLLTVPFELYLHAGDSYFSKSPFIHADVGRFVSWADLMSIAIVCTGRLVVVW